MFNSECGIGCSECTQDAAKIQCRVCMKFFDNFDGACYPRLDVLAPNPDCDFGC